MSKGRKWCIASGTLVLASLALAHWHSPYWMILTGFVGLDMLQSGFTNWGFVAWMSDRAGGEPSPQKQA